MRVGRASIAVLILLFVAACVPRNALGIANISGVNQQIEISEEDASLLTSEVTIKFDGEVVERSLLSEWQEEARTFGLFVLVRNIEVDGSPLRVRREFRSGGISSTLTYQFFENNRLIAAVPIAF